MPILSDTHLHSHHSGDSKAPMEAMILQGISLGLKTMCFTEHNDYDFPEIPDDPSVPRDLFLLDTAAYRAEFLQLQEKYKDKIQLLFGIELGLQPQVAKENAALAKAYPFDFIIGSTHLVDQMDPYYPSYFAGRSDLAGYRRYFEQLYENILAYDDYDALGHLDYVVRYGATKDRDYTYEKFADCIDPILLHIIRHDKALELNTAGVVKGMKEFNPCTAILKRYKALGGKLLTVGSDAHAPAYLAAEFAKAGQVLKACGFTEYCIYKNRTPHFYPL